MSTHKSAAILISEIDHVLKQAEWYARSQTEGKGEWSIEFHIYGQHGRVGGEQVELEPDEIFIIGEVLAQNQILATQVSEAARIATVVSIPCSMYSMTC
jgi:hypothetical protein